MNDIKIVVAISRFGTLNLNDFRMFLIINRFRVFNSDSKDNIGIIDL